ncbi:hypothetical protein VU04_05435, partial [Desulfobulbus sp. TB]|nr:hypothetical protein [Desulfobulbus sp. TB]
MSDNTAKDDDTESQENLDGDSTQETTQHQEKKEKKSKTEVKDEVDQEYKNYKSSRALFEECLQKSFSETGKQELISIILNNFPRLGRKISDHYEIDKLINLFIDYCASHGEFKVAWSVIKEKRPIWYNDFFPRWRLAVQQEEHIDMGTKKPPKHT